MDAISAAGAATGGDGGTGENASELISRALREVSSVSAYEERIAQMEQMLTDIDNLLSDFNHEISSYLSGEEFDDEVFYQTEKRLDEINHLKSIFIKPFNNVFALMPIHVSFDIDLNYLVSN